MLDHITVTMTGGESVAVSHGSTAAAALQQTTGNNAIAAIMNGLVVDLSRRIEADCALAPVNPQSAEGLEVLRHSTAHLLAQAVKRLYPQAQVTIGPVIRDGFYYDFAYEPGFTPEDLDRISKEMSKIVLSKLSE